MAEGEKEERGGKKGRKKHRNGKRIEESNTQTSRASKKLFAYPVCVRAKLREDAEEGTEEKKTELKNTRARMAIDRRRGEVASDGCQRC